MPKIGASGERNDAQHSPARIDKADRHLCAAVQRLTDLRAGAAHYGEGFLEDHARLGLGDREGSHIAPVRSAAHRETVPACAIGQDESVPVRKTPPRSKAGLPDASVP